MIDRSFLQDYSQKNQTSFENVLREYVQHLFLRSFYSKDESRYFLFKGGTALRIAFGSPRFSEDLDFTGIKNSTIYENVLENTLVLLKQEGIEVDIIDSKQTTGGHIANIKIGVFNEIIQIGNQVSFRSGDRADVENIVVSSDLSPAYNIYLLAREILIEEKLTAFLTRAKPRDYFDLYFILRNEKLRKYLNLNKNQMNLIVTGLKKMRKEDLKFGIKKFLPKSFWGVIEDLPSAIIREI